jgi:hypothetical protein
VIIRPESSSFGTESSTFGTESSSSSMWYFGTESSSFLIHLSTLHQHKKISWFTRLHRYRRN